MGFCLQALALSILLLLETTSSYRMLGSKARAAIQPRAGAPRASKVEVSGKVDPNDPKEKYTAVPQMSPFADIRPSINDKARTITHVCTSGTLCTTSAEEGVEGSPFGSYVDYVLDKNGWPVLLLSEQSLHTVNIKKSPPVSLFCQLPRSQNAQSAAALSRVTIIGKIEPVPDEELSVVKLAFTLTHSYALQIAGKKILFACVPVCEIVCEIVRVSD